MNRFRSGLVLMALLAVHAGAQSGAVAFNDGGWQLRGDSVRVEEFDGRSTLSIKSGFAYRRDMRMMDGTIDVDVMTTERRSFAYLMFRMQSDSAFEDFYLRPHKSNAPDAIQYAPTYQQQSAWQLYHGATGTASVNIPDGVWNHLRIVLRGRQAAFFLNDTLKPALVVQRLGHEPTAGYLALRGFLPAGVPGVGPIVRYANLRVRPDVVPFTFPAAAEPAAQPGVVTSWLVGDAFDAPDSVFTTPPSDATRRMRRVATLPNGLLELHRVVPMKAGANVDGVVARLNVVADAAGTYRMDLGFSDKVTVLVNGVPLVHRDDAYDYANRRDGLVSFSQAALFLPLKAGQNTLDFIVTDVFGGWGIMGRFPSTHGLRLVEP